MNKQLTAIIEREGDGYVVWLYKTEHQSRRARNTLS